MEADWEIEIDREAPIIDSLWPGFVDLRLYPDCVTELAETKVLPALADALIRLNGKHSPVWTSKCDVWPVKEFDRFELDAPPEAAADAMACYIDLLPTSDRQWAFPQGAIASCEELCARFRGVLLRCCRVDLVIRRALIAPGIDGLGVTAYLIACGPAAVAATAQLEAALAAFAHTASAPASAAEARSKLQ